MRLEVKFFLKDSLVKSIGGKRDAISLIWAFRIFKDSSSQDC